MTRRNIALMAPDPEDDDEYDPIGQANDDRWQAASETVDQVASALNYLDREASSFLRMPYPSLDAIMGGIAQGDIWFAAAFSGRGKTTLLSSIVDEYVAAGRTVYFMGLESRPNEIRTHLACRDLTRRWYASGGQDGVRVDGGDVLSGALQGTHEWVETRKQLVDAVNRQSEPPMRDRLIVDGARFVNEQALRASCRKAASLNTSLMVIDHIDHIGGETGGAASFEESVRACNAVLEAAGEYGMRMLCATQLNNQGVRADPLASYRAPQPHHVYLGPQKRMIATGMIGLYRPLRSDMTPDEMKAAREERADISVMLEPNVMGIVCMKNRKQGRHEGKKISLGVEHGRVFEMNERDKYATSYDSRGPRA